MLVTCFVEVLMRGGKALRGVRKFKMLPRVGDTIIVRPNDEGPRKAFVRSVIHRPARNKDDGTVLLQVALS